MSAEPFIRPTDDMNFRRCDLPEVARRELGYIIKAATLRTLATRGGGPPYIVIGGVVYINWGDFVSWLKGRTSPKRRTAVEGEIQEQREARDRAWYRARDKRIKAARAERRAAKAVVIRDRRPSAPNDPPPSAPPTKVIRRRQRRERQDAASSVASS
jgi:hypothetical protein